LLPSADRQFSKFPLAHRPTAEIGTERGAICQFLPNYAPSPLENHRQTV
jgi:hypothetical protein